MRLARPTIHKEWNAGTLRFEPNITEEDIGPSSIDLKLDTTFIFLDKELQEERDVGADVRWRVQDQPWKPFAEKYGRRVEVAIGDSLELIPHTLVLGFTLESMQLPTTLAGRVEGKSGPARRGLLIHLTAPTIQAGYHGKLQLEIYNVGPASLMLEPGKHICQLGLEQVTEPEQYEGQFQSQA